MPFSERCDFELARHEKLALKISSFYVKVVKPIFFFAFSWLEFFFIADGFVFVF